MNEQVYFDNSLYLLVDEVSEAWGVHAVSENLVLRDAIGRLTFVVLDFVHSAEQRTRLSHQISARLMQYVEPDDLCVATPEELFDSGLRNVADSLKMSVSSRLFHGKIQLLDRRVVGADWLRTPRQITVGIPRLVFASLKGGVGRSTALCVLAAHLSGLGRRVLAVDMDVEAPGIGSMLLTDQTMPSFGLLDYLVETGLGNVDDDFINDMVSYSWLGAGRGLVSVVPALGQRSLQAPANILSKIARAYLVQSDTFAQSLSVADRFDGLLSRYAASGDYDIILIDARAGLHETTASAILGIGAKVLLFGTDQPQTYASFRVLFSNLSLLPDNGNLNNLHIIQAKSNGDQETRARFANRSYDLLRSAIEEQRKNELQQLIPFSPVTEFEVPWVDKDDPVITEVDKFIENNLSDSLNCSAFVLDSELFRDFDPLSKPHVLTGSLYEAVYGELLKLTMGMLDISSETPDAE